MTKEAISHEGVYFVNQREKIAAKHISEIMHRSRVVKRMTQMELAGSLGISQSAYSKMENGILIPSAVQWFEFCELMDVGFNEFYNLYRKQTRKRTFTSRPTERMSVVIKKKRR